MEGLWGTQGWPQISLGIWVHDQGGAVGQEWGSLSQQGAVSADPPWVAGGVSPQSLSEWRMQNIARDSENSSEEEFFDAHGTGTILEQAGWGQGHLRMGMQAQGCPPTHASLLPLQRICLTATRSLPRR